VAKYSPSPIGLSLMSSDEEVFAICDRAAEVQTLLHDHLECGKHIVAEVVARASAGEPKMIHLRHSTIHRFKH
jgi:hypothetical protein